MSEPQSTSPGRSKGVDPEVTKVIEDRTHAINQMIIDARASRAPFPNELVAQIISDSTADGTLGVLLLPGSLV